MSKKSAKKSGEKARRKPKNESPQDSALGSHEKLKDQVKYWLDESNTDFQDDTPLFRRDQFYCLDGGFASSLQELYSDGNIDSDPLWSCRALKTDPDAVVKTHEAFLKAGANIISTNSYQANHELFRKHIDFKDPIFDPHLLIESSVELADKAIDNVTRGRGRGPRTMLAGSVGPYGACLGDGSEYTGSYIDKVSREELREWHRDRLKRLTFNNPVDIIAVETIPSYVEALAILDCIGEIKGLRCWISFQCKDQLHTARGERIDDAFKALYGHEHFEKVMAVGVNCVKPSQVWPLLKCLNSVNHWSAWPENEFYVKLPYVVYPNAGEDWDAVNKVWKNDNDESEDIVSRIGEWMCLGANAIGGCCRVGPTLINQISDEIIANIPKAMEAKEEASLRTRNPRYDWSNVEKRLQKPSYDEQKKRDQAIREKFKDFGDGGDAQSLVQAQIEALLSEDDSARATLDSLKSLQLNEDPLPDVKLDFPLDEDETNVVNSEDKMAVE